MTTRTNATALLEEIRRRQQARAACAAHEFARTDNSFKWKCRRCEVAFDAGEVLAYVQGLTHGRAGHVLVDDGRGFVTADTEESRP